MFTVNDIKNMKESELLNFSIEKIMRDNPHLKRGEDMTYPVCLGWDGKLFLEKEANNMEKIEEKYIINAKTIHISCIKFIDEKSVWNIHEDKSNWIYFYQLFKPPYYETYSLGKEVTFIDAETYTTFKKIVTQEIIEQQNLFIRYGVQ